MGSAVAGSQILQTDCEVNTEVGCNILPAHKAQQLFGQEWLDQLDQPQVHIEAYGGQSVHSLGSCVWHLHIDNKAFPTISEVTNMTGPVILGRTQAKAMGYIQCKVYKNSTKRDTAVCRNTMDCMGTTGTRHLLIEKHTISPSNWLLQLVSCHKATTESPLSECN